MFRGAQEAAYTIAEGKKTPRQQAADPDVKPLAQPDTTGIHNRIVDNVNGRPTANSAAYLVRRLKRDAPEIAEALGRGELATGASGA